MMLVSYESCMSCIVKFFPVIIQKCSKLGYPFFFLFSERTRRDELRNQVGKHFEPIYPKEIARRIKIANSDAYGFRYARLACYSFQRGRI